MNPLNAELMNDDEHYGVDELFVELMIEDNSPIDHLVMRAINGDVLSQFEWYRLSSSGQLDEEFICSFEDNLVWYALLEHQKIPEKMLMERLSSMQTYELRILQEGNTPNECTVDMMNEIIQYNMGAVCWDVFMTTDKFDDALEENSLFISWLRFSMDSRFVDENRMLRFAQRLHWVQILGRMQVSSTLIMKVAAVLPWNVVIDTQKLNSDAIKFAIKNGFVKEWFSVMFYSKQEFSEQLLQELIDSGIVLNWYVICAYQRLSIGFIEQHIDLIGWEIISFVVALTPAFYNKYHQYIEKTHNVKNQIEKWKLIEKRVMYRMQNDAWNNVMEYACDKY